MVKTETVKDILVKDLTPIRVKLLDSDITMVCEQFVRHEKSDYSKQMTRVDLLKKLIAFLELSIKDSLGHIAKLRMRYADFKTFYAGASTNDEKKEHILNFAKELGALPRQIVFDRRAFSRWFGADTVQDRYNCRIANLEKSITFYLERLSYLAMDYIREKKEGSDTDFQRLFRSLRIEQIVMPLISYNGDNRVRIGAFHCLSNVLSRIPEDLQKRSADEKTIQYVYKAALDENQSVWIQCEALKLLETISRPSLKKALRQRLTHPLPGDDLFVRSRAVGIMAANFESVSDLESLFTAVTKDPSPFVRQSMADALEKADTNIVKKLLPRLALEDKDPKVRAHALLKITLLLKQKELFDFLLALLSEALKSEKNEFTLRVGVNVCARGMTDLRRSGFKAGGKKWYYTLGVVLDKMHISSKSLSVRRWAAQARERMWSEFDDGINATKVALIETVKQIKPGRKKSLDRKFVKTMSEEDLGRLLAVISQNDFPLTLKKGLLKPTLYRGFIFGFRVWRFLFEFRHPSPDKRQAFSHTIGRFFHGNIHCHSGILCELAETKVPGEPLYMPEESGWRPYLPLVDELFCAIDNTGLKLRSTLIYSSEGITEIKPPRWFYQRLWARLHLTLKFSQYARMRNWEESSQTPASSYINALKGLGFNIRFKPYTEKIGDYRLEKDPTVARFFHEMSAKDQNG
jgi:gamma-polyglutamate synthase